MLRIGPAADAQSSALIRKNQALGSPKLVSPRGAGRPIPSLFGEDFKRDTRVSRGWQWLSAAWIPVTLLASSAQTLRNAMQRDLIDALGAAGAAQVRFVFGLPLALMFPVGLLAVTGVSLPRLTAVNFAWTVISRLVATRNQAWRETTR